MRQARDAAIRAARTFLQTFLGVYLAGIVGTQAGGDLAGLVDLSILSKAAAAGVVAAITFVHVVIETRAPAVDTRQGL